MAAPIRSSWLTQGAALGGAFVSHLKDQLKGQLKDVRGRMAKAPLAERTEAPQSHGVASSATTDDGDGFDGGSWRSAAATSFPPLGFADAANAPARPRTEREAELGAKLAARAERSARLRDSRGRAASAVRGVLAHFGLHRGGGHAYELAGELAKNPRFVEVDVARHQLQLLSAGAVVVWGRSVATRLGHASISLGDGREASDHIKRQTTDGRFQNDFGRSRCPSGRNYRVFLPREVELS